MTSYAIEVKYDHGWDAYEVFDDEETATEVFWDVYFKFPKARLVRRTMTVMQGDRD